MVFARRCLPGTRVGSQYYEWFEPQPGILFRAQSEFHIREQPEFRFRSKPTVESEREFQ